jgi:hypothetical protein
MSAFLPPALKNKTATSLGCGTEAAISRGVTTLAILPAYLWWSEAARWAAVREPPEPVARRGSEAELIMASTNGSIHVFIAQEYVLGNCANSEA